MTRSDKYRVVLVTAPKITVARKLAKLVLEKRLAACVNIVSGVESHYWWEGKVCRDTEVLLVMKTAKARLKALEEQVLVAHPYDTPEFVVLPIESGSKQYLDWIDASTD
jgi:periplasmic divalent cation tolerance protein